MIIITHTHTHTHIKYTSLQLHFYIYHLKDAHVHQQTHTYWCYKLQTDLEYKEGTIQGKPWLHRSRDVTFLEKVDHWYKEHQCYAATPHTMDVLPEEDRLEAFQCQLSFQAKKMTHY